MSVTIDEDSSHLHKVLPLSIVFTCLYTGETLPHRSTHSCNILRLYETSKNVQKTPLLSAGRTSRNAFYNRDNAKFSA